MRASAELSFQLMEQVLASPDINCNIDHLQSSRLSSSGLPVELGLDTRGGSKPVMDASREIVSAWLVATVAQSTSTTEKGARTMKWTSRLESLHSCHQ